MHMPRRPQQQHPQDVPRCRLPARGRQRGAGALIVVLVLFFVMALVAAYSSRNLLFEQKTSANQYRSTQAFEAAEAGVEWALAMLNTGRIDNNCAPATGAAGSFRQRYLAINPTSGLITQTMWINAGTPTPFRPTCVLSGGVWACSCPDTGDPVLAPPGGAAQAPAFRLEFRPTAQPGVVLLRSQGCTRLSDSCLGLATDDALGGDAATALYVLLALKGAITTAPTVAVTARGSVSAGTAFRSVNAAPAANSNPPAGYRTINAGGTVDATGLQLSQAGGILDFGSVAENNATLGALDADRMFTWVFGMARNTYRQQPAAIVRNCPAECDATALASLAADNPGRILWLEGDADLTAAVTIGSPTLPALPVVVVVNGNLTFSAATQIHGLVYVVGNPGAPASTWATAGNGVVYGAAVAEGNIGGTGTPTFSYDAAVLNNLRLQTGSFVRVPGGWKDFP